MNAIHSSSTDTPADNDGALLRSFENGTLDPAQFSHRRHLQVAWAYLRRDGFTAGAAHFCTHLKAYVASVGATGKYHETITWAYLVLLNEEMSLRTARDESFDEVMSRRPDLLDHRNGAIAQRYTRAELDNPDARRVFMLPSPGTR
jgi:hypothetical protein